jgi:hypothetical protein
MNFYKDIFYVFISRLLEFCTNCSVKELILNSWNWFDYQSIILFFIADNFYGPNLCNFRSRFIAFLICGDLDSGRGSLDIDLDVVKIRYFKTIQDCLSNMALPFSVWIWHDWETLLDGSKNSPPSKTKKTTKNSQCQRVEIKIKSRQNCLTHFISI